MLDCISCGLKYFYLHDKLCEFCDIVYNLKKTDSYKYIVCYSEMDQDYIIKKTYDYFMENDIMPAPNDIDFNSIIVSVNPYIFRNYIKHDKCKIFFTNCINRNNIKTKKFLDKYPNEKFDIIKYSGIELKKIDEKTYNDYVSMLNI